MSSQRALHKRARSTVKYGIADLTGRAMFGRSLGGKSPEGGRHPNRRRSMHRRLATLFFAALVPVSGAVACGGVQEELQKRAEEEAEKRRQEVEQQVQEERTKIEEQVQEKVQEGGQRVEEEIRKGQRRAEKGQ
jgi:hypothetical protein